MQLWRRLCFFLLIALLCSFFLGFFPLDIRAQQNLTVHNLNTGYSYATIKDALDDNATLDGHVIRVDEGVYYEHVTLLKAVHLLGEDSLSTIIDGQENGTVIDVLTSNVIIDGFTIRHSGNASASSGVHIYGSSSCNVFGNIIENNSYGIWVQSCSNSTVYGNNLTSNYIAVYVDSSADSLVSENNLSANDFAAWLSDARRVDFQSNDISGNNHAVWITQSVNLSLNNNRVVDNADGVLIYNNSNTVSLLGNTISSSTSYAIFLNDCPNSTVGSNQVISREKQAIFLQYSPGSNLTDNTVSCSGYDGIYLYQSGNSIIDRNVVTGARGAITVYSSVYDTISGNSLFGNDQGIVLRACEGSEVFRNKVSASSFGIQVSDSSNLTLSENNVTGSTNEGIGLAVSSGNELFGNSISGCGEAIVFKNAVNNRVRDNQVYKCGNGLRIEESSGNSVLNNTISLNDGFGVWLNASSNNTLTDNSISNNFCGMQIEQSSDDLLMGNEVWANNYGISVSTSSNCTVLENDMRDNNAALVLNMTDRDLVYANVLAGNTDGITLLHSRNNTLELNVVPSSSGADIRVSDSNFNFFLHNSFFNSSQRTVSFNSTNSWDNGLEGNFWGYKGMVDSDMNGIADTPLALGDGDKDNFPLIAEYSQVAVVVDDRQYTVGIMCNSSVSDFWYFRHPENLSSRISFTVSALQGTVEGLGICRLTIPRALIQAPFEVTVDNVSPLYQAVVGSNVTHSWLYFSFPYVGGVVRIANPPPAPPFWTEFWFLGIVVLSIVVAVLALAIYFFYRRLGSYRRTIEEVERKLTERETTPLEVARRLFSSDVEKRSVKIGKFEEKYGVKIRPRESLDDVFRGLDLKKKENKAKEGGG